MLGKYRDIETGSQILDQYIVHICRLYDKMKQVSEAGMTEWDIIDFKTYLHMVIVPKLNFDNKKIRWRWSGWPGSYHSLWIEYEIESNIRLYLEIQARPYYDRFSALLGISHEKDAVSSSFEATKANVKKELKEKQTILTIRNNKRCVAASSKKELLYENGIDSNTEKLLSVVRTFENICNKTLKPKIEI